MIRDVVLILNKHDATTKERMEIVNAVMSIENIDNIRIIQLESGEFRLMLNAVDEEFSE